MASGRKGPSKAAKVHFHGLGTYPKTVEWALLATKTSDLLIKSVVMHQESSREATKTFLNFGNKRARVS
jgi:hypothetical protein